MILKQSCRAVRRPTFFFAINGYCERGTTPVRELTNHTCQPPSGPIQGGSRTEMNGDDDILGGGFKYSFIFTPDPWGNDPI